MIRRVFDSGGTLFAAGENFVVGGTVNAAIPSVAVTNDGVIGVFFYTCNGIVSGLPQFTAWLAVSTDQGTTWSYQALLTFLSPAIDNGDARQRVLGDYVQMKALDNCFYGSFVGNRGRLRGVHGDRRSDLLQGLRAEKLSQSQLQRHGRQQERHPLAAQQRHPVRHLGHERCHHQQLRQPG